jgi:predicted RNA-binding protein with TRAM domain
MFDEDRGFGNNPPVNVGDELDVTIEAVGEKGDGIARKDGFILFVPNTKEGEQVHIRVNKVLRKVGFADVVMPGAPAEEAPVAEAPAAEEPMPEAPVETPAEETAELPPAPEAPAEEVPAEPAEAPADEIPPAPDESEEKMEAELPPPPEAPDGVALPSEEELKKMEEDLPAPEEDKKEDEKKEEA